MNSNWNDKTIQLTVSIDRLKPYRSPILDDPQATKKTYDSEDFECYDEFLEEGENHILPVPVTVPKDVPPIIDLAELTSHMQDLNNGNEQTPPVQGSTMTDAEITPHLQDTCSGNDMLPTTPVDNNNQEPDYTDDLEQSMQVETSYKNDDEISDIKPMDTQTETSVAKRTSTREDINPEGKRRKETTSLSETPTKKTPYQQRKSARLQGRLFIEPEPKAQRKKKKKDTDTLAALLLACAYLSIY